MAKDGGAIGEFLVSSSHLPKRVVSEVPIGGVLTSETGALVGGVILVEAGG
jgi:hypothetical protein